MTTTTPRRIAVTGSTGLIGSALVKALRELGDEVLPVVRSRPAPGEIYWSPAEEKIDRSTLEGVDAIVHLAGESVAQRWTEETKRRIRRSREQGTALLAEALAELERPPAVLLSASAVGVYGDRGDAVLTEESGPGEGFLAEVAQAWEGATRPAARRGIRVAHLRFGIVLSPEGGALGKMLLPFRLGVGGPIGSGEQWMSWVTLQDAVRAILFSLDHEAVRGPVNIVAPEPVTNAEFARTLGRALHRPAFLPVPGAALRLLYGEMADEALLAGQRVHPARLREAGFVFQNPDLEDALRSVLA